jgi:hypothetical protein
MQHAARQKIRYGRVKDYEYMRLNRVCVFLPNVVLSYYFWLYCLINEGHKTYVFVANLVMVEGLTSQAS